MSTSEQATGSARAGRTKLNLSGLQKFGRSLMLPIAALPVAGLMLRLGADDMLGADGLGWGPVAAVVGAGGSGIFDHLPLLFALGIAIGMARKSDGSTALAAVVGYLTFEAGEEAMSPYVLPGLTDPAGEQLQVNFGVLGGVIIGLVAAVLWQRYHRISLPPYLAFFGGRRFVPIITALASLILAVLMSFIYPAFNSGLTALGEWVAQNSVIGGFVYGTANRLLIPLGLHHILNSVPWFVLGSYDTGSGVVHGDIARFLSGDPTAGAFMTGFFPIMMFALPAAALAIAHEARPAVKKATLGLMVSVALTSFLTGVTEPLEFAFMFVAWPLYVLHAVLTGTSLAVVNFLGIRDGFSFSAGLFDFVLNFRIAEKPLLLIVVGLVYAVIYYVLFRVVIRMFDLKTPGRAEDSAEVVPAGADTARSTTTRGGAAADTVDSDAKPRRRDSDAGEGMD